MEVGSIEAWIDAMQRRGLKLSNLFERDDGAWQVNVRDDAGGYEFGRGPTAVDALEECLLKAVRETTIRISQTPAPKFRRR